MRIKKTKPNKERKANARVKKEKKEKRATKKSGAESFFTSLAKATENDLAQAASNGILSGDIKGWIDTGVYLLNGQLSGSAFGGVPDNKIIVFAGPEATGKTFFVLSLVKHFLDSNPEAGVFYFESESAIDKRMLEERGIDTRRVYVVPVSTVQEWRTQSLKILKLYKDTPEDERRPMMFVLDSLGMLSTTKEMEDSEEGKETADMTRSRLIKAAFRTLTLKLGVLKVPFLITNHTYDTQGMFSQKVMSGGSGTKYSNSITVFLSKAKDKEAGEVTGCIITCTLKKGRLTKENTIVKVKLDYAKGLSKYYGLLELAAEAKLIKRVDSKYEFPDGTKVKEKQVLAKPEEYFTPELMEQIEKVIGSKFRYGVRDIDITDGEDADIEVSENDVEEEEE